MTDNNLIIAPSLLSADFTKIDKAVALVENCGLKMLHLDVMDGVFVPQITFGSKFIKDIRKITNLYLDTHLMVVNPEKHIEDFIKAGADSITIHLEGTTHLHKALTQIKESGIDVGVSIVPSTSVSQLLPILDLVDSVLVMTVNPGFGGQELIQTCLTKVVELVEIREAEDYNFKISVDGGVNLKTIEDVASAGADIAVAGSAFFHAEDQIAFVEKMKNIALETKLS